MTLASMDDLGEIKLMARGAFMSPSPLVTSKLEEAPPSEVCIDSPGTGNVRVVDVANVEDTASPPVTSKVEEAHRHS